MNVKEVNITGLLAERVSKLYKPPDHLYVRGQGSVEELLSQPRVGVVGTRTPSAYGVSVTKNLVRELVRHGVVIVSGLALGTDGLAHQTCIESHGQTIAVLPSGIERIYPSSHTGLAAEVEQHGLLLSEYPGDSSPRADQFIARNRLIAALSDLILIPEAAERSGSLHTANFALEMNIPVAAVPGNITSRLSAGTNKLISQGALPVLTSADILEQLGISSLKSDDYVAESVEEAKILDVLKSGLQDGSQLRAAAGLEPRIFLQTLTLLEIKGVIKPLGADKWQQL